MDQVLEKAYGRKYDCLHSAVLGLYIRIIHVWLDGLFWFLLCSITGLAAVISAPNPENHT